MASDVTNCFVISDGRRGIENQALGLAEALKNLRPVDISNYHVNMTATFKALPPRLQFAMHKNPESFGLPSSAPDLAIGCGRQAIAPLLAMKAVHPGTFTLYVQDPRLSPKNFDLVIAPEHDAISGPNVIAMIGSPNRITDAEIIGQTLAFGEKLLKLNTPRAAMLIGGDSKTHNLGKDQLSRHLKLAKALLTRGYSLMITTSRRTPAFAVEAFSRLAEDNQNIWQHNGNGENPYFAFLGGADIILVTEDSTNMLTEATRTGKPVFTLPMKGNAGKFSQLYERLRSRCGVLPFTEDFLLSEYEPLDETSRVAALVWERIDRAKAEKINLQ